MKKLLVLLAVFLLVGWEQYGQTEAAKPMTLKE